MTLLLALVLLLTPVVAARADGPDPMVVPPSAPVVSAESRDAKEARELAQAIEKAARR